MGCCKAKEYDNWCVGAPMAAPIGDRNDYCIFHAPVGRKQIPWEAQTNHLINNRQVGVSSHGHSPSPQPKHLIKEEFNQLIFEHIEKCRREDIPCNLSGTIFEWDIYFSLYDENTPLPEISFKKVTFCGKAYFLNTVFNNKTKFSSAIFKDTANFGGATFNDKAFFNEATFNGETYFVGNTFKNAAIFSSTLFEQESIFSGATFKALVSYYGARFIKDADFGGIIFKGEADFDRVSFSGIGRFNRATFHKEANFDFAKFNGEAIFTRAYFISEAIFSGATFSQSALFSSRDDYVGEGGVFSKVQMNNMQISGPLRLEGANLSHASFLDTDMRKLELINCTFDDKSGSKVLYDERQLAVYEEGEDINPRIEKVETLYRQLKQKAKTDHNEAEASEWHFREKEMRRKRNGILGDPVLSLYYLTSGYAERALWAAVALLVMIGLFALPIKFHKGADIWASILSVLQYASLVKEPHIQLKSVVGGFYKLFVQLSLYTQTAILALAVRNRYRR